MSRYCPPGWVERPINSALLARAMSDCLPSPSAVRSRGRWSTSVRSTPSRRQIMARSGPATDSWSPANRRQTGRGAQRGHVSAGAWTLPLGNLVGGSRAPCTRATNYYSSCDALWLVRMTGRYPRCWFDEVLAHCPCHPIQLQGTRGW